MYYFFFKEINYLVFDNRRIYIRKRKHARWENKISSRQVQREKKAKRPEVIERSIICFIVKPYNDSLS